MCFGRFEVRQCRLTRMRQFILLAGAMALLSGAIAAPYTAPGPATPPANTAESSALPPQEVEVTGERPGPRLWRVSKGEHVIWLLGTLDPLPRKMIWRSKEVESVLGEVQAVIPTNPAVSVHANPFTWVRLYFQWRGVQVVDGNGRLKDVIPAGLYARVMTLVGRYDNGDHKIERLKPIFAALRLYRQALDFAHLVPGNQAQDEVLRVARKRGVPIVQSKLKIEEPRDLLAQIGQLPHDAQINCLEAVVERLETGMEPMQQEAAAWAMGDVGALRQLMVPKTMDVCTAAISLSAQTRQLIADANTGWDHQVDLALANNRSTLALKPIHELIGTRGILAAFEAKGYQVEGP
jgi:uncharacterized protein YbaP (TraB family)